MFETIKIWWKFRKDKRVWRFIWERWIRGFSEFETWSLDYDIAKFTLPRLKYLRKLEAGYPGCFDDPKEWYAILDKMIYAMDAIVNDCAFPGKTQQERDRVQEGCKLFGKWFQCLWW